jgi:DNA-binding LacI/PurR family transcriptional regulator
VKTNAERLALGATCLVPAGVCAAFSNRHAVPAPAVPVLVLVSAAPVSAVPRDSVEIRVNLCIEFAAHGGAVTCGSARRWGRVSRLADGNGQVGVTIREVAREAGVSISTVSRAFTMPDLVSPATKATVEAVAERLGYRPNRAARALITGKTGNIGVIVADLRNPFFHGVLRGAQARAREADHWIFLADSDEDPRTEQELISQMAKQVDGIAVCGSRMTHAQVAEVMPAARLVFFNRQISGAPAVLLDDGSAAQQAAEHLAALGHREIAYLAGPAASWSNGQRLRSLKQAAKRLGLSLTTLGPFAPGFEGGVQAADLAYAAGVSAVVAYNDLMAIGVLSRFADRRIEVPARISVISFDDIPMAAMTNPPLTTMAMPKHAAGRAVIELLLRLLADQKPPPATRLPCHLNVRGSTSPRGAAA